MERHAGGCGWVLAAIVVVGCEGKKAQEADPSPSPSGDLAEAPIEVGEVAGHWSGDWGHLYLRVEADGSVRGVYDFAGGTMTGQIHDGVLTGWWCQAPERKKSAGEVTFRFTRGSDGVLALDGRWRVGHTGTWYENWDLRWNQGVVEPAIAVRFDDASQFCAP